MIVNIQAPYTSSQIPGHDFLTCDNYSFLENKIKLSRGFLSLVTNLTLFSDEYWKSNCKTLLIPVIESLICTMLSVNPSITNMHFILVFLRINTIPG